MAGYNNYFPLGYQPAYYPQAQQNNQQGVIWVQGEAMAKSYLVAPNSSVALWDSEEQVIYLKSADASGMPTIKTLDYTIRDGQNEPQADFATKEDVSDIRKELASLKAKYEDSKKKEK